MKKAILSTLLFLAVCGYAQSQTVKLGADGNYTQVKATRDTTLNLGNSKLTGKTYTTSKGDVFPVYSSINGKLFIVRTSGETGRRYKQYLKIGE